MFWEWFLSGLVGVAVAYLAVVVLVLAQAFVLENENAEARVMSWIGWLRTIQRVQIRWDADVLRGAWKQVLEARVHEDRIPRWQDLERWLQEDAHTEVSEEIVIVTRRRLRPRYTGMLYATLYPLYIGNQKTSRWAKHDRCVVWHIVSVFSDPDKDREELDRLWKELRKIVGSRSRKYQMEPPPCEYYFEAVGPGQEPACTEWPGECERRELNLRFLCSEAVGAQVVDLPYRIPDWEEESQQAQEESGEADEDDEEAPRGSPGMLLYVRYVGDTGSAPTSLATDPVLDFVYGTVHVWGWTYGDDVLTLEELERVVTYFSEFRGEVSELAATPTLALHPYRGAPEDMDVPGVGAARP